jgi:hypothetical protein
MTWQVFQILKCYLMGILLGMPFCRQARRFYVFLIIRFLVLRVSIAFLFQWTQCYEYSSSECLQICSRGMLPKRNGWFPNTFKAWEKACPWWGHITFSNYTCQFLIYLIKIVRILYTCICKISYGWYGQISLQFHALSIIMTRYKGL